MHPSILHKQACKNIPDLPIRSTSTWIAIVPHTVDDVSDIKSSSDLMWVKAHENVTVETLKYQYFARHPLESFKLRMLQNFPRKTSTVRELNSKYSYRGTDRNHVLVLRAIELEDEVSSDNDSFADAEEFHAQGPHAVFCGDSEDPIVLSEDDGEDGSRRVADRGHLGDAWPSKGSPSTSAPQNTITAHNTNSPNAEPDVDTSGVNESHAQDTVHPASTETGDGSLSALHLMPQSTQHAIHVSQQLQYPRQGHMAEGRLVKSDDRFTSHLTQGIPQWPGNIEDIDLQGQYTTFPELTEARATSKDISALQVTGDKADVEGAPMEPLFMRVSALPLQARELMYANFEMHQHCGICTKYFHLQPWTEFAGNALPLCTSCSWHQLHEEEDEGAISWMVAAIRKQDQYKHLGRISGLSQDMDPDALTNRVNMMHDNPSLAGYPHSNELKNLTAELESTQSLLSDPSQTTLPDWSTHLNRVQQLQSSTANDFDTHHGREAHVVPPDQAPQPSLSRVDPRSSNLAAQKNDSMSFNTHTSSTARANGITDRGICTAPDFPGGEISPNIGPGSLAPPLQEPLRPYKSPYQANADTLSSHKRAHEAFNDDIQDPRGSTSPLAQYSAQRDDFSESPPPETEFRPRKIRCVESAMRPPRQPSPPKDEEDDSTAESLSVADPDSSDEEEKRRMANAVQHQQQARPSMEIEDSEESEDEPLALKQQRKRAAQQSDDSDYEAESEESEEELGYADE
ncbi:MAG: hypothetical protein M1828_002111 [Chrysothrix sp. TS-e1954]|nr:MAG: hypothetical protein M1828_002111 [Chrysothrix sp. TS-e1954]